MNEKDESSFVFLPDDPIADDKFSGKGHKRSAQALANILNKLSNDNHSIGLEGAWGSGKTTVVKIAEKELKASNKKKFAFFSFDLWANQGVDFRRAFLEELLNWSKQYSCPKKQGTLEARIQGKTKTVETESERHFSVFGYILMSALFLLPFLGLWLSPFAANLHKKNVATDKTNLIDIQFPWIFQIFHDYGHKAAFFLLLAVIFGFLGQTLYLCHKKKSLRKALNASFSLFSSKSEKDTVTQTIRDGDPTKYEFHKILTEILSPVQKKHQVVLVFDNIDRLPTALIQEVWASIRSISSRDGYREKSSENIVIAVIPYDRKHVLSAFKDKRYDDSGSSEVSDDQSEYNYVREDIFRKTFSAIITVAPPVTSDVQDFFEHHLEKALPNRFDSGQKYRLFQIFDEFLTETGTNPTPRQVKSFINDAGMLWHQWQNDISIEAIAIFVLHRTKIEAEPKLLQNPDTIRSRFRHFAPSSNLDSELAALAYNVEPEIALEILLERDITAALRNPNNERLQELSASAGFKQQLDRILMKHCDDWASSSLKDFETVLTNYSKIALEPSVRELCNRHFTRAIPQLEVLELSLWDKHKPLFQIVECISKNNLDKDLLAITQWINKSLPELLTENLGREWIKFIGGFIQEVRKLHGADLANLVASSITIPYSAEFYLGVALDCDEVNLKLNRFINTAKTKSAEISSALISMAIERPVNFNYVWNELHPFFKNLEKTAIFTGLIEQIQSNLLDNEGASSTYLKNLILVSAEITNKTEIKEITKAAIADGSLPWHAYKAYEAEDWDSITHALWIANLALKTNTAPALLSSSRQPFGDLSVAYNWFIQCYSGDISASSFKKLSELAIKYQEVNNFISEFIKSPENAFYKGVLTEVLSSEHCPPIIFNTLLKSYTTIKEHFSSESIASAIKLIGDTASIEEINKLEINNIPPALIQDISSQEASFWTALLDYIDQHLKTIKNTDWIDALTNDNHNRKLLLARSSNLSGVIPPNHLRGPLAEFVSEIITTKDSTTKDLSNHNAFWFALSPISRKGVSTDILELIADKPIISENLEKTISVFPDLFAELPLESHPETAITKILIPLLKDSPENALEFVKKNSPAWANCIEKVLPELRSQLNEYFSAYDELEEHQAKLNELRRIIKLRRPRKPIKPNDSEKSPETSKEE